ncbi:transposase, partial [methanotrophic bacterial endosymbiont of Bathymodiolus sp.]
MKPRVMAAFDALLLRKRSIIETINDQLKNIFQLEHSRHRSLTNYMINIVACLVAYSYQEKSLLSIYEEKICCLYYESLSRTQVIFN